MKKRIIYFFLCVVSLVLGGTLYIVFRPDTYVNEYVRAIVPEIQSLSGKFDETQFDFIKYYFPDFIWALSFNSGLNVISPEPKKTIVNGIIVSLVGVLWEILQKIGIVSGTGDFIDVLMYIFAVALLMIPNIILLKNKTTVIKNKHES